MMKMNLIAGFVCVTLLSACSSQKITAGDGTPPASSTASTEVSGNSGTPTSPSNNSSKTMLEPASNTEQPAAAISTSNH